MILNLLFLGVFIFYVKAEDCNLDKASENEKALLNNLNRLFKGKNYQTNNSEYNFYFAVCDIPQFAADSERTNKAGFIQSRIDNKQNYTIGSLKNVDLEGSDLWIRVTYLDGDQYGTACNKTPRKTATLMICDPRTEGELHLIEENHHREDCLYSFELRTSLLCPKDQSATLPNNTKTSSGGLGAFSIILIVLSSLLVSYFIFGALFMRFVRGKRSWHQIPNFLFWNRIGNFQADLCDYVCRCNGARDELDAQPYESLSGQLSDDENILNI